MLASVGPGKAYVKGFEIVNKETKYIPIDKARETLNREDIRLKTKGLPTYRITNTYNSVPLNAEGAELTAYPDVYLSSVFNDGSIGLNDTEASGAVKQTISRRGQFFDINQGLKTIYLKIENNYATTVAGLTGDNFRSTIGTLHFIQARNSDETPSVVNTGCLLYTSPSPRDE